jgi:peptide/nickel transport system substrate-binding protein
MNFPSFLGSKKKRSKWPSKKQWLQLFSVLTKKERLIFLFCLVLFVASATTLITTWYYKNTVISPAGGGHYTEGVVGSPRFINPIYAQSSDVDRDLVEIIFSSLVPDLAKNIEVKDDGKTYEVSLKDNIFWHDGQKLTADDVIFTVEIIQNPDYKSPLRANYLGVEVEKMDDYAVRFKLKNAYSAFMERLDLKIIPKHIWQNISPQNFLLTNYNLKPVGSGPYFLKNLEQDNQNSIVSLDLARFNKYFEADVKKPYLKEISFRFFASEEDLVKAAEKGGIDGFSLNSPQNFNLFQAGNFNELSLSLPRYFAVFFNDDKSKFLQDKSIRQALNYATDKEGLIQAILLGRGAIADSPILPDVYGYDSPTNVYGYDKAKAEELIAKAGWTKEQDQWIKINKEAATEFKATLQSGSRGSEVTALQTCLAKDPDIYPNGQVSGYFGQQTKEAVIKFQEKYAADILTPAGLTKGTGSVGKDTRSKLNEICFQNQSGTTLKFTLATVDDPILQQVALALKTQWAQVGITLEIATYPTSQLTQEVIKPRNYEMLLFGEVLESTPDPYPFWHSSQVKDPGLNLANYENNNADKLLEAARVSLDEAVRAQKYQQFQDILIADAPCVFLYRPEYVYFVEKEIKGLTTNILSNPSKRFADIENWYIKERRAWQ